MKILLLILLLLSFFSCSELSGILIESTSGNSSSQNSTDQKSESPIPISAEGVKFFENIEYGPNERNKFDIFLPNSEVPTGIVIFIHGGGFIGGDKSFAYSSKELNIMINALLNKNIAFATINYHLLQRNELSGVSKSLDDTKKALQYLRLSAEKYNLDKTNVILMGASAGAGASLWMALSDDMAEINEKGKINGESTRVKGVIAVQTQGSYDLLEWPSTVFKEYQSQGFDLETITSLTSESVLLQFYGVRSMQEIETPSIQSLRDNLDFLTELSSDDPELYLESKPIKYAFPSNANALYHHPLHSKALMDKAKSVNVQTRTFLPTMNIDTRNGENMIDFVVRKFSE